MPDVQHVSSVLDVELDLSNQLIDATKPLLRSQIGDELDGALATVDISGEIEDVHFE